LAERFRTGSSKERKERKIPAKRKAPSAKSNGHAKRARKKRTSEDSDEDEAGSRTEDEDSDVEMTDVGALASKHRKSDASEAEKQTRASRLSARTRAKERLSNEGKSGEADSDG